MSAAAPEMQIGELRFPGQESVPCYLYFPSGILTQPLASWWKVSSTVWVPSLVLCPQEFSKSTAVLVSGFMRTKELSHNSVAVHRRNAGCGNIPHLPVLSNAEALQFLAALCWVGLLLPFPLAPQIFSVSSQLGSSVLSLIFYWRYNY